MSVPAIAELVLENVRVFKEKTRIELGKLTLFAGANSSGKSSAMLGALLLKQTLDATFDPGPLLLHGEHVQLTSFDQLQTVGVAQPVVLGVVTTDGYALEVSLRRAKGGDVEVAKNVAHGLKGRTATITPGSVWRKRRVGRSRFFLGATTRSQGVELPYSAAMAAEALEHIIHVPGLRTPPQRSYPLAPTGETFPGRFDNYVASVLLEWSRAKDDRLVAVNQDLVELGLTWKVDARRQSDSAVNLRVGRLRRAAQGGAHDLVDVADVGVGVSQALPVVVALRCARPGQVVYIEQPELHLHPRAQTVLARILVRAAARGVRVVVETHSSMLLLGVQTAILTQETKQRVAPEDVLLHWFSRTDSGQAAVTSNRLDANAGIEGWPGDFDEVELAAHRAYLDAVEG